jgi:glycosyltransferase involved in cell wall biosynthesis
MVSFQHKLRGGLEQRGIQVTLDLADRPYQAVLVIGGTRQLPRLWSARRSGAHIVQRLDGMNWLHRLRPQGLKHNLRAEYGNWILAWVRSRLAQSVVYQSEFSRRWWERVHGPTPVANTIIYNGVDLAQYTPDGPHSRPEQALRILLVEGSLAGGYETGLAAAVELAERLQAAPWSGGRPVELMVAGRIAASLRDAWSARAKAPIHWAGLLPIEEIPALDRSAHLLYSADLNAACPNSVIEALACGLPVVAFDTGALPELLTPASGRIAPYGGDPWKLDPPDISALAEAAGEVLANQDAYRQGARQRAEQAFGLDHMVSSYLQVLLD